MTHKEIVRRLNISPRTVRHALSRMKSEKLIVAQWNDWDLRSPIYSINAN